MRLPIVTLAALTLVACSAKEKPDGKTDLSAAPITKSAPNPAVLERVKAHAEGCTVNVESGLAYQCKPGISDATTKIAREVKPADFVSTLAEAARGSDPKLAAAAVAILADSFDDLGEDGKKKNATPVAVELLLAALKESTGGRAARLSKPATHTATIAKAYDKLYAVVDGHAVKAARDESYRSLLTFGRLDAFPKIKEVATKKEHADAALDAVVMMYKPTPAEKEAVCPWAQTYLGDPDGEVAASAGKAMVYCRGKHIDALLAEADKRLAQKQYKNPFAMVMREPCFQFAGALTPSAADIDQCERVYTFLEKAANDPGVDDATRGLALFNIYYQRRDVKTLRLMRKYEKSPNKEVAKRAQEAIKSLTEQYKLKD